MTGDAAILKGVIHGKTIELERAPGLPDGQAVSVVVRAAPQQQPGDGLRSAFGAWADDAEALEAFLLQVRRDRGHQGT